MEKFTIFKLLEKYSILIPALQRNYVHGRDDAHAKEVREHFVDSIVNSCAKKQDAHLDLVYGILNEVNGVVVPIDGQQRLTSLWLFAVYCARVCSSSVLSDCDRHKKLRLLARFSYESRPLASTFCRWLTSSHDDVNHFKTDLALANSQWGKDPTVQAMVTTLGLICEKVESEKIDDVAKLVLELSQDPCESRPKVTFDFREVNGDATDLYVKINARGKSLTQWENFKGKFSECLTSNEGKKRYFDHRIEELSDKFFDKFNKLPDDAFFALFGRVADYVILHNNQAVKTNLAKLASLTGDYDKLPYVPIEEFCLESSVAEKMAFPLIKLMAWAIDNQDAPFPYWQAERTIGKAVFCPKNQDELDFALFLFRYVEEFNSCEGLGVVEYRPLRLVANILENVAREGKSERSPCAHFNRIVHLERFMSTPMLYTSSVQLEKGVPFQCYEEVLKARIYDQPRCDAVKMLNDVEAYMHGRVRIAIATIGDDKIEWSPNFYSDKAFIRLGQLHRRIADWRNATLDSRESLLRALMKAEPWELRQKIDLSLAEDALRAYLTTSDDVSLQKSYLDGEAPDGWQEQKEKWRRDWRRNIFSVSAWKGCSVKWHTGTGTYYLYDHTNITNAMPISDWRFDLINTENALAEIGAVESIRMNEGATRSFRYVAGSDIKIYLWKEAIEVRWFRYLNDAQKSGWIYVKRDRVEGRTVVEKIKDMIDEMRQSWGTAEGKQFVWIIE